MGALFSVTREFAACAGNAAAFFSLLFNSEYGRAMLLRKKFSETARDLTLSKDFKYVEQGNLAEDVRRCYISRTGGVKVIWAPAGSGKSTTVRHVLKAAYEQEAISGVIFLTPPRMEGTEPDEWFRSQLSCFGHETLGIFDHLSDVLTAPIDCPYVIVFDQCDNLNFDSKTSVFMKTLAEDSVLSKSYVVIALCASAVKAKIMWGWNWRSKITLVGARRQQAYKWREAEIDQWIEHYLKYHEDSCRTDETMRDEFKAAAIKAGAPEFLVTNVLPSENAVGGTVADWQKNAEFYERAWSKGQTLLV
jgi:hypothetical protein